MSTAAVDFDALDAVLRAHSADMVLSTEERFELREVGAQSTGDQIRFMRNRAFDITRDAIRDQPGQALDMLRWLEQVVRTLDLSVQGAMTASTAVFSPGDACLRKLVELCRGARTSMDICVFTIADDRLTTEILQAHRRGVQVRIISDNDKRTDTGSDIDRMIEAGVEVRMDPTPHHMHHKFALFDAALLANGSFNWTRSASMSNFENLVVSADPYLIRCFGGQFGDLWSDFDTKSAA